MDPAPAPPADPARPDEVNRLWHHGMHEERLFHDRLNYFFSAIPVGLLGVFAILYHKDPAPRGVRPAHRRRPGIHPPVAPRPGPTLAVRRLRQRADQAD